MPPSWSVLGDVSAERSFCTPGISTALAAAAAKRPGNHVVVVLQATRMLSAACSFFYLSCQGPTFIVGHVLLEAFLAGALAGDLNAPALEHASGKSQACKDRCLPQ